MNLKESFFRGSRLLAVAFFLFSPLYAKNYILNNENIISNKTAPQIEAMGSELYDKSNISVYLSAQLSANGADLGDYVKNLSANLSKPYVILMMLSNDKVIDIISSSDEVAAKFNKVQILSPIPEHGSIKPLLTIKKDYDAYTAALFNGYADIVDQIAKSDNITLSTAVGDANRRTLDIIRFIVYAMFAAALLIYIYKKVKYRHGKDEKK